MVDALRKLLLAGLGTLDLTEEKAKAIFNDLVARGEMSEKDARELVQGWAKRAAEQRTRLQQDVDEAVSRAMNVDGPRQEVRGGDAQRTRGRSRAEAGGGESCRRAEDTTPHS